MVLEDLNVYRNIIGCLMKDTTLLLNYQDIMPTDFLNSAMKVIYTSIRNMFVGGKTHITPIEIDQDMENYDLSRTYYLKAGGVDLLQECIDYSILDNFDYNYKKLKKLSLINTLRKNHYDVSYYFQESFDSFKLEKQVIERFEAATLEDILDNTENKLIKIREDFLTEGCKRGDASTGIAELIEEFKNTPSLGAELNGELFNAAARGARKGCYYLKSASTSAGKAIPNYTVIPTPTGFRRVDEIKVGDYLFGDDGKPTKVLAVYPQVEPKRVYEVEFADGRIAECCEDHLWQYSYSSHHGRAYRVEPLKKIIERTKDKGFKSGRAFRFRVPYNKAVEFEPKEYYPSPYTMGLLLGDGSFRYNSRNKMLTFSSSDEELIALIADDLNTYYKKNPAQNFSWTFPLKEEKINKNAPPKKNLWVEDALINYPELWDKDSYDKFIPEDYLIGSVEQRLELLRGLMDTDGSIDNKGMVRFTTVNTRLKDQVVQLVRGLGYCPTVSIDHREEKYRNGVCYSVIIHMPVSEKEKIFKLTRKKERAKKIANEGKRREQCEENPIIDIRATNRYTDMTCFTVDNSSHLFLMNDFIVTHNTRTSVFDACKLAFPVHYDTELETFVEELDQEGRRIAPVKTLFIVTEMEKSEIQSIMLAYVSKVNEDHILSGRYELNEYERVIYASKIIQEYKNTFFIEEISNPNLTNVSATVKRYAAIEGVEAVFFDYIHTTGAMMSQFTESGLREDSVLMLMSNQLKQLAKDCNIFMFSATQVNANAMADDGEFKNETCIRGS